MTGAHFTTFSGTMLIAGHIKRQTYEEKVGDRQTTHHDNHPPEMFYTVIVCSTCSYATDVATKR